MMSFEMRMSFGNAFGKVKKPALQVQSTTLGTLVHSRHSQLQLTLVTQLCFSELNHEMEINNEENK
jgi:hypothetical protein